MTYEEAIGKYPFLKDIPSYAVKHLLVEIFRFAITEDKSFLEALSKVSQVNGH